MLSAEQHAEIQQMDCFKLVQVLPFLYSYRQQGMSWKGQPITQETIAAAEAALSERWEARCKEEPATPSASKPTPSPPPTCWSSCLASGDGAGAF